jgi:hypothetical protein
MSLFQGGIEEQQFVTLAFDLLPGTHLVGDFHREVQNARDLPIHIRPGLKDGRKKPFDQGAISRLQQRRHFRGPIGFTCLVDVIEQFKVALFLIFGQGLTDVHPGQIASPDQLLPEWMKKLKHMVWPTQDVNQRRRLRKEGTQAPLFQFSFLSRLPFTLH